MILNMRLRDAFPLLLALMQVLASTANSAVFVGTTPADSFVRDFLGGLAPDAECHGIVWRIALSNDAVTAHTNTYQLRALYRVPVPGNTNHSKDGPEVVLEGSYTVIRGAKLAPAAEFYRLAAGEAGKALSLLKIGRGVLQVADGSGRLAVGHGGASYTLYDNAEAEQLVAPAVAATVPDMSYRIAALSSGPDVFGVFEGRTPCHGISRQLKRREHAGCTKAKWRVTLHRDPVTQEPTRYKVEGTLYRTAPREGTWNVSPGLASRPAVYELGAAGGEPAIKLLKGDENVLFFVDEKGELLVGNAEFSYTLNRRAPKTDR